MIDSVLWPAAISFIRSDGTLGAFHYHAVPKIYKLGKFKAETSANSWHSSVWYALKPGHWEFFGKLDNWLFISRFNDLMMLYSLLKLLTISVSKMLLEDLGISSTFPRWLFKHWWEKIVYKCYCNNHVGCCYFCLALLFLRTFIIKSYNYYVKYSHIHIYRSIFPPRCFLES